MKCRNIVTNSDGSKTIVWFGSIGKKDNGDAIKAENYVDKQEGLAASLTQRLSIIKGELVMSDPNYGLPLLDKVDKTIMDSVVIDIILTHPDVKSIMKFTSVVEDSIYKIDNLQVLSVFNENIKIF